MHNDDTDEKGARERRAADLRKHIEARKARLSGDDVVKAEGTEAEPEGVLDFIDQRMRELDRVDKREA